MDTLLIKLFTNTINTLLIIYFIGKVLNKTWDNKQKWIISLTLLIIVNMTINRIFSSTNIGRFTLILILSSITYSYLLNVGFVKILMKTFLGTILMFSVEIVIMSIMTIILKISPSMLFEDNFYLIMGIIVAKGSFYLIIRYLIGDIIVPMVNKQNITKPLIVMCSFNIIIIFTTFVLYENIEMKSPFEQVYLIGMALASMVFSFLIYKITKIIIDQNQKEMIWRMKEEEFHKEDFYLQSMNEILHTITSQRHDLHNYLSTLYGLIYLEKFEEAKKYITEINERLGNMTDVVETNNPVITSLITMKKNVAFKHNIKIELDIDLPEEISCDSVDLSIILGNLLDNAIEACQIVEEDMRKIKLSIYAYGEELNIKSSNAKKESIEVDIKNIAGRFTTKEDCDGHGYGLGNVKHIVKQYNGTMDIEDLGKEFKVDISLTMGNKSVLAG